MTTFKVTHKLAALATAALMAKAGTASAAINLTDTTENIVTASSTLPNLISTVAYVGGIGLGVAGVFKLKQHVDNPAQHAMKDGLVRLGAGGGLLVLPYLTDVMQGNISAGGGSGATAGDVAFEPVQF